MIWKYRGKKVTKIPEGAYGFVYCITYIGEYKEGVIDTNKFYIGKKALSFSKKKRLTLKERRLPENKRKRFKIDTKESDWKTYNGSSLSLQKDIELYGEKNFRKDILCFCPDKINLTYKEMELQFKYDVLRTDSWNMSIANKFFRGRIK